MQRREPFKDGLIINGWNDQPQPCPKPRCRGLVIATNDIRYGQCTSCRALIPWRTFQEQSLKRRIKYQKSAKTP